MKENQFLAALDLADRTLYKYHISINEKRCNTLLCITLTEVFVVI